MNKSIKINASPPEDDPKKSFNLKDAGIKDVINKSYKWIVDKFKDESSSEIEIRKELEDQVEQEVETDDEVSEDKGVIKDIIDKIVTKVKDESSFMLGDDEDVADEEEEEVDEDEDVDDRDEDLLDEEDMMDMIKDAASSKTLLWIRYRDQEGNETEREIEPWELRDEYYMFAHDPDFIPWHGSDIGTRQFILASILDMHGTKNPYKNPSRWDMKI